jgi:hypothetical protein
VTAELSPIAIALISAGSALAGSAVGAGASILTTWLTERAQRRRHRTELAFNAAIEQYKSDRAFILEVSARRPGESFRQYPLDDYLIGMVKLVRALDEDLPDEELAKAIEAKQQSLTTARDRYHTMAEVGLEELRRRSRREVQQSSQDEAP